MSPEKRFRWPLRTSQTVVAWLLLLATLCSLGQTAGTVNSFVIDPNRPYVYLTFDHIGVGIRRDEGEPSSRIWLRLVNNCRVPITVSTFGVPAGSPEGETGVMDEVVHVIVSGVPVGVRMPETTLPPPLGPTTPEQRASTPAKADEMPSGYMSEVRSSESIQPSEDVLFSVPTNHVSKRWYFEIPFHFDLPIGKGPRDENIGGEPRMVVTYSMWDMPSKYRADFEQK
jgi:hypothetical protein